MITFLRVQQKKKKKKLPMVEFGFVKSDYFQAVFVMNMITAIPFLLWWPQKFPHPALRLVYS